jgi:predicted nucleotidyltransferase
MPSLTPLPPTSAAALPIEIPQAALADLCRRFRVAELALFGSVLRDDFRPDSDVDLLVTFEPGARRDLFDLAEMQRELEALLGRRVDLVERRAVEASENYIRRKHILSSLRPLYVAG